MRKEGRDNEVKYPAILLVLSLLSMWGIMPSKINIAIPLLNLACFVFWLTARKTPLAFSDIMDLVTKKKSSLNLNNQTRSTASTSTQRSTSQNVYQPNVKPQTPVREIVYENRVHEKGWEVDDTIHLEVNLLTIEDVIFPIMLKNEYERIVRTLIIYTRKLNRYNAQDIEKLFGREGFSSYLNDFFSKFKSSEVRSVYLKSLYLILNDYSQKDDRVKVYLERIEPLILDQTIIK